MNRDLTGTTSQQVINESVLIQEFSELNEIETERDDIKPEQFETEMVRDRGCIKQNKILTEKI